MNILDAMKSGYGFKRKNWDNFYSLDEEYRQFAVRDILADDWVVHDGRSVCDSQLDLLTDDENAPRL